jgi:hypothetical protein
VCVKNTTYLFKKNYIVIVSYISTSIGLLRKSQQGNHEERELHLLSLFGDPKSVTQKINPTTGTDSSNTFTAGGVGADDNNDGVWRYPMNSDSLPRPMNILALGGSNTWGVTLNDRYQQAYPYLIGYPFLDNVHNLAMVEMGATYASMCLQSILSSSSNNQNTKDDRSTNYDIILLDFVLTEGFPTLLQRLRMRYPDAILIYLHIWPLKALLREKTTQDSSVDWEWITPTTTIVGEEGPTTISATGYHPKMNTNVKRLVKNEGGYVYHLPLPNSPRDAIPWFAEDWWHLSEAGHKVVANDLLQVLWHIRDDIFTKPKRVREWLGVGDQCITWFLDGGSASLLHSKSQQKNIKKIPWGGGNNQNHHHQQHQQTHVIDTWVLEIEPKNGGSIKFENKFTFPISVVLAYLINTDDNSPYSSVEVSIDDAQEPVRIDPNYFYTPPYTPKVKYARIGIAQPAGESNSMIFRSIQQREKPFRSVGLFLTEGLDERSDEAFQRNDVVMTDSGYHVVFCFIQPFHHKSNYTAVQQLLDTTIKELDPTSWNVHVITSDDTSIQSFSTRRNLHVVDYRNAPPSHRIQDFRKTYIHQSLNNGDFEFYCMLRWIIISDYFNYLQSRGIPVKLILTLETDVLFLEDPLLIDTAVDWKNIESYKVISGVALLWSLQGINNFANFLLDSYSSREKAMELVRKYAKVEDTCHTDRSLLIPCFQPEGAPPNHLQMYHISDMYWYLAWVEQNPSLRIAHRHANEIPCRVAHPVADTQILLFRDEHDKLVEKGVDGAKTICVIYFGRYKELILPFLQFLRGNSNEYTLLPTSR